MPTDPVSEPDELYGLPFEEFVAARDALAREVRRGGDRAEADRIKALRKPGQPAWAINQVARNEPDRMAELLEAGERLRAAQAAALAGHADARADLRSATADHRAAVDGLVTAARELPGSLSAAALERVRETLQAVAAHPEVAGTVAAGRLTHEVSPGGGWPEAEGDDAAPPAAEPERQPPDEPEPEAEPEAEPKKAKAKPSKEEAKRKRAEEAERRAEAERRREAEQRLARARKERTARAAELERAEKALAAATERRERQEEELERAVAKEAEARERVEAARRAAAEADDAVERLEEAQPAGSEK